MSIANVKYLTREEYLSQISQSQNPKYWEGAKGRWNYHLQAIRLLQEDCEITAPTDVLEIGTMGVKLVSGSDTMDIEDRFDYHGKLEATTYLHDARDTPWPIPDKAYKCCVALRVFHHLHPKQMECFREARRIAENVIIVAPHSVGDERTKGITPAEWYDYNFSTPPKVMMRTSKGSNLLLFWDRHALSD